MSLVWNRGLETGVAAIDEQHIELFGAINDLLAAMSGNRGNEEVVRVIAFLKGYVVKHFGMEERLMKQHRYPDQAKHVAEHQGFVRDFLELEAELSSGGATSSLVIQVNRRVCTWLREHIATSDRALGAFLTAQRIPGPSVG